MKSLEELGELVQAVAKTQRAMKGHGEIEEAVDSLSEEMADVKIMLSQLSMMFDNDLAVAKKIHDKTERQRGRMAETSNKDVNAGDGDWELAISS